MDGARRVLVGVTGGIAAYKIPLLVRLLRKNGCEVKTVLTPAAKTLVGIDALRTLSGNHVYLDGEFRHDMDHIRLSEWADVFAVCPATANTIAKMACGVADNLLTTLALSIPAEKIMVAPAMNSVMWANRATQANVSILRDRGIDVLPVEEGELACGVSGPGRMVGIEEIARRAAERLGGDFYWEKSHDVRPRNVGSDNGLCGDDDGDVSCCCQTSTAGDRGQSSVQETSDIFVGKNILISSGPTEEPIDPVRVITNRSSGKMGAALARAARDMGANVTVVSGPAAEPLPPGVEVIPVKTAAEMGREMGERFGAADVCIMAAAVSDYRPANPSGVKLHRSGNENITLELTPNPDILAQLGASKKPAQFLIGFSLESGDGDGVGRAAKKMKRKKCDMMVFNKAETSLGGDSTAFSLLSKCGGRETFVAMGKPEAAKIILNAAHAAINAESR